MWARWGQSEPAFFDLGENLRLFSNDVGPRVIETLAELDEILEQLDEAAAISDDELRKGFTTFSMRFPLKLPADPDSLEYRKRQFDVYEHLHGEPYSINNEVSNFDVNKAASIPFPFYTGSPQTVGNQLISIGHVIRTLNLKPGMSVLEFGPGWGNTTIFLAQMGYKVTAVDIEPNFVALIKERANRKSLEIETLKNDFSLIQTIDKKFDAVLFFECFHHCSDHQSLIAALDRVLLPGGKVFFAAEPITDDFPIPWGLRMDGESLWAIRKHGWLELGFQESYFRSLLLRHGWKLQKEVCKDTPWGTIFVASRISEKANSAPMIFAATNEKLQTEIGMMSRDGSIHTTGRTGYLVYGPYAALEPGKYRLKVKGELKGVDGILGTVDVAIQQGKRVITTKPIISLTEGAIVLAEIDFELDQMATDLEFRIHVQDQATGSFSGYEVVSR